MSTPGGDLTQIEKRIGEIEELYDFEICSDAIIDEYATLVKQAQALRDAEPYPKMK